MTRCITILATVLLLFSTVTVDAENWPEFRGPSGQGHSIEKGLPTEWSTTKNVAWKTEVPGLGWSSPVVYDGKIYLTSAVPREDGDSRDRSLRTLCFDSQSGNQVWNIEVFDQKTTRAEKIQKIHGKNSYASPTPITDGKNLFVHFGTQGTACLTLDGDIVWKTRELKYQPQHGSGGSPILVDDLLIVTCDGRDVDFVIALDQKTGKIRWKTDRTVDTAPKFSFSTPLAIEVNGRTQIVCPGTGGVQSYDPRTGRQIWSVDYPGGYSVIPRPVFGHGLVYVCSGYGIPSLYAIDPTGEGNITKTHVKWKASRSIPHTPSALLIGDELYFVSDRGGVASCLDAKTGKVHWQRRLGGAFSSSPLFADGKIYFQSEQGEATVIKPGRKFIKLSRNQLEPRTFASYAVVDSAILIRTEKYLYRIEDK